MSLRTLRRRMGEAVAAHNWLEGVTTILGLAFLALAGLCLWAVVTAVASFGDADTGFELSVGSLKVTRAGAVVLFSLLGLLAIGVGWFLVGDVVRRWGDRLRGGR